MLNSDQSATGGGNYISTPWTPSRGGGTPGNTVPDLPYPIFMKNQKSLFGDIFDGGGSPTSQGRTSQGGGPVSGAGSSFPANNTMDTISGRFRGLSIR